MTRTRSISRYRLSSDVGLRIALAALLLAVMPMASPAQQQQTTTIELQSPILVIDQDRLFAETRLGAQAQADLEARAEDLTNENQRIEAELIARERELTELRPDTPADEFRVLADEFDARVERIRAEQDEKARELNRARDEARQAFFQNVAGIISEIVLEKGAVLVIDRRDVFLSADRIDITDEAIVRVNEQAE